VVKVGLKEGLKVGVREGLAVTGGLVGEEVGALEGAAVILLMRVYPSLRQGITAVKFG
jgi:hypothetical protein